MNLHQKAASRLSDGSAVVARRIGRTLAPKSRPLAALIRCGAALYVGRIVVDLMHQQPMWAAIGACIWCRAAWRAKAEKPDAGPEPASPAHTDSEIYESAVEELRKLIGNRNGALLSEVLVAWRAEGWIGDVTAAELGRQLVARGIPVRASLKVAGAVNAGVHRDDLPALPQPLPESTLVKVG